MTNLVAREKENLLLSALRSLQAKENKQSNAGSDSFDKQGIAKYSSPVVPNKNIRNSNSRVVLHIRDGAR